MTDDWGVGTGYCECGCGGKTNLARDNRPNRGWIKGKPLRFLNGHNQRLRIGHEVDPETGCWNWTGSIHREGYGHFVIEQKRLLAHRYMYEQHVGPIPDGLTLDHLCRNRRCVNPEHLEPVSLAENLRRGNSRNVNRKLTAEDVAEIRRAHATRDVSQAELARRYSVVPGTIWQLLRGQTWAT